MDFTKFDEDESSSNDTGTNNELDQDATKDGQDSQNSTEEDSDDDEENNNQIINEINILQEELRYEPYNYAKHIDLITKFRIVGELNLLREARENMNQIFPLSSELWLEWIEDETNVASTNEQRIAVIALYKKATSEYLNTKLWLNFVDYAVELYKINLLSLEDTRETFNQSLNRLGYSVSDGILLWRRYRDFEISQLNEIPKENLDQVQKQIKNIHNTFLRQFSLPLMGMMEDYQYFEQWLDQIKLKYGTELSTFISEYEKSLKILEHLGEFELKLQQAVLPRYEEYLAYLDYELKINDDLARIQCLFERAISENCLQPELWLKYLRYCDSKIVVDSFLIPIYERAVRNCPWVAKIWIQYMLAIERLENNEELNIRKNKFISLLEKALTSLESYEDIKQIWITCLTSIRRNVCRTGGWNNEEKAKDFRELFNSAIDIVEKNSNLEFCYDMYRYLAKIETIFFKNIENARIIWKKLIENSYVLKKQANFWLDYANMELSQGHKQEYRKILLKGLNTCSDYVESLGDALLRFELEEGECVEQYQTSVSKYENALKKINEQRSKKIEKEAIKIEEQINQPNKSTKSLKRKIENDDSKSNIGENKKKKNNEQTNHGLTIKTDESKRDQTIFLSNLSYDLKEDEIREVFLKFGSIVENGVRLVRNFKGVSKGFCFVEYEKIESAREALLHDRMLLRGRPVFISEMDKRNHFAYSTEQEKNKVFVKNIPFEFTTEDLQSKVFANYTDSISKIRLVTHRDGRSRGLAFIEMINSSAAEKLVKEMDDYMVGDRKLFVAISNPSLAKGSAPLNASTSKPHRETFNSASLMVPHSVAAKAHPSKVKIQLNATEISAQELSTINSNPVSGGLSNSSFRSMFLK